MLHLLGMPEERIVPQGGYYVYGHKRNSGPVIMHYTCVVNNCRVFVWETSTSNEAVYMVMLGDKWPLPAEVIAKGREAEDNWLRSTLMEVYRGHYRTIQEVPADPVMLAAMIYDLTSGGNGAEHPRPAVVGP